MMKALIISVALLGTISAAHADWHYETTYRDLVRPNGQPRSAGVYQSDLDFCSRETHVTSKLAPDSAAFKQCMLSRNWRWVSQRVVQTPSAASPQRFGSNGLEPVRVYPDPDGDGSVCKDYEPPGGISWTECSNF
jgi:hypothetical protein